MAAADNGTNPNAKHWWDKFDWRDWFADERLAKLHPTSTGIWINALGRMFLDEKAGELRGTLEELAEATRAKSTANMAAAVLDLLRTGTADVEFSTGSGKAVEILREICGGGNARSFVLPQVSTEPLVVTLINRRMRRAFNRNASKARKQKRYRERRKLEALGLDIPPEFERVDP